MIALSTTIFLVVAIIARRCFCGDNDNTSVTTIDLGNFLPGTSQILLNGALTSDPTPPQVFNWTTSDVDPVAVGTSLISSFKYQARKLNEPSSSSSMKLVYAEYFQNHMRLIVQVDYSDKNRSLVAFEDKNKGGNKTRSLTKVEGMDCGLPLNETQDRGVSVLCWDKNIETEKLSAIYGEPIDKKRECQRKSNSQQAKDRMCRTYPRYYSFIDVVKPTKYIDRIDMKKMRLKHMTYMIYNTTNNMPAVSDLSNFNLEFKYVINSHGKTNLTMAFQENKAPRNYYLKGGISDLYWLKPSADIELTDKLYNYNFVLRNARILKKTVDNHTVEYFQPYSSSNWKSYQFIPTFKWNQAQNTYKHIVTIVSLRTLIMSDDKNTLHVFTLATTDIDEPDKKLMLFYCKLPLKSDMPKYGFSCTPIQLKNFSLNCTSRASILEINHVQDTKVLISVDDGLNTIYGYSLVLPSTSSTLPELSDPKTIHKSLYPGHNSWISNKAGYTVMLNQKDESNDPQIIAYTFHYALTPKADSFEFKTKTYAFNVNIGGVYILPFITPQGLFFKEKNYPRFVMLPYGTKEPHMNYQIDWKKEDQNYESQFEALKNDNKTVKVKVKGKRIKKPISWPDRFVDFSTTACWANSSCEFLVIYGDIKFSEASMLLKGHRDNKITPIVSTTKPFLLRYSHETFMLNDLVIRAEKRGRELRITSGHYWSIDNTYARLGIYYKTLSIVSPSLLQFQTYNNVTKELVFKRYRSMSGFQHVVPPSSKNNNKGQLTIVVLYPNVRLFQVDFKRRSFYITGPFLVTSYFSDYILAAFIEREHGKTNYLRVVSRKMDIQYGEYLTTDIGQIMHLQLNSRVRIDDKISNMVIFEHEVDYYISYLSIKEYGFIFGWAKLESDKDGFKPGTFLRVEYEGEEQFKNSSANSHLCASRDGFILYHPWFNSLFYGKLPTSNKAEPAVISKMPFNFLIIDSLCHTISGNPYFVVMVSDSAHKKKLYLFNMKGLTSKNSPNLIPIIQNLNFYQNTKDSVPYRPMTPGPNNTLLFRQKGSKSSHWSYHKWRLPEKNTRGYFSFVLPSDTSSLDVKVKNGRNTVGLAVEKQEYLKEPTVLGENGYDNGKVYKVELSRQTLIGADGNEVAKMLPKKQVFNVETIMQVKGHVLGLEIKKKGNFTDFYSMTNRTKLLEPIKTLFGASSIYQGYKWVAYEKGLLVQVNERASRRRYLQFFTNSLETGQSPIICALQVNEICREVKIAHFETLKNNTMQVTLAMKCFKEASIYFLITQVNISPKVHNKTIREYKHQVLESSFHKNDNFLIWMEMGARWEVRVWNGLLVIDACSTLREPPCQLFATKLALVPSTDSPFDAKRPLPANNKVLKAVNSLSRTFVLTDETLLIVLFHRQKKIVNFYTKDQKTMTEDATDRKFGNSLLTVDKCIPKTYKEVKCLFEKEEADKLNWVLKCFFLTEVDIFSCEFSVAYSAQAVSEPEKPNPNGRRLVATTKSLKIEMVGTTQIHRFVNGLSPFAFAPNTNFLGVLVRGRAKEPTFSELETMEKWNPLTPERVTALLIYFHSPKGLNDTYSKKYSPEYTYAGMWLNNSKYLDLGADSLQAAQSNTSRHRNSFLILSNENEMDHVEVNSIQITVWANKIEQQNLEKMYFAASIASRNPEYEKFGFLQIQEYPLQFMIYSSSSLKYRQKKENKNQETSKEEKKNLTWILLAGVGAVVLLAMGLYFYLRKPPKTTKMLGLEMMHISDGLHL